MTDIEGFLAIYGHSDNLLNNKDEISASLISSIFVVLYAYFWEKRSRQMMFLMDYIYVTGQMQIQVKFFLT